MKALIIARKSLLEAGREFQLLALTVVLPLVFLTITWATYNSKLLKTHKIWMIGDAKQSQSLITEMGAEMYADGSHVFDIGTDGDILIAKNKVEDGQIVALIQIEGNTAGESMKVKVYGDALSSSFYRVSTILENILRRIAWEKSGKPPAVKVVEYPLRVDGPKSEFDLYAPGMITFGLLMIIPQTAMIVSRELRWKTLSRLQLSRIGAWDLFAGISLAQMGIAVAQVLIVFLAAVFMGFNHQGSLALAVLVGLVLSASAVGQGLLVACFAEDDSQSANIGGTLAMIQVFLSGSFYQLPPLTIFTLAGHQIDVFDIIPATHGFRALQQVLSYGDGLGDISFRLGATLLLSLVYFAVGVLLFHRLKMVGNKG